MKRSAEALTHTQETLSFEELLQLDLPDMKQRIAEYKEKATKADRVVVTIICCDSRVVLSNNLVPVTTADGKIQNVLFISVPTIGSGAPSRSRLRGVAAEIMSWGVAPANISFLATQHGDTHEVAHQHDSTDHAVSCGLRKVLLQNSQEMMELSDALTAWSFEMKSSLNDITFAPDRVPLQLLREKAPEIMAMIDAIHYKSGEPGKRLPRRLIIRAAYRNYDSNLAHNSQGVVRKLREWVLAEMETANRIKNRALEKLTDPVEIAAKENEKVPTYGVGYGAYDHLEKTIEFDNRNANLGFATKVEFAELEKRSDRIQSPEYCIVSFGTQTIPLAVRELLPHLCGAGSEKYVPPKDNAFRTVASIPTVPTLLCAMAESMYAVLHRLHPHEGDANFADLKKLVIVCDTDEHVQVVREMMSNQEFIEEYLPMLSELQPEGITVVNLNTDKPEVKAVVVTVGYGE